MKFSEALLYVLSLIALLVMAGAVLGIVLALHDANFALGAEATAAFVFAGILWVLTLIAEKIAAPVEPASS
jgi:hypothetical protein